MPLYESRSGIDAIDRSGADGFFGERNRILIMDRDQIGRKEGVEVHGIYHDRGGRTRHGL